MPDHKKRWKVQLMNGTISHTPSGNTKSDIKTVRKNGVKHYVWKKKSTQGKKNEWPKAVKKDRKNLGIKGFVPVGGHSKAGKALYKEAKALYY